MRRREQIFEKKMFHELSFLKFFCDTQFTRLVHLCYFVQNRFFFNTRLAVSAFQLDLHKVMTLITWIFVIPWQAFNHNLHVQKTHSNSDFINSMIYFVNAIIFKMLSENQRKYEKKQQQKKENKEKKKQQLMQSIKIKENIEGT